MTKTTSAGYVNKNRQTVIGPGLAVSNHYNQRLYTLECDHCGVRYDVNGCDIHIRK